MPIVDKHSCGFVATTNAAIRALYGQRKKQAFMVVIIGRSMARQLRDANERGAAKGIRRARREPAAQKRTS
jgi:hypothetical protein